MFNLTLLLPCSPLTVNLVDLVFWIKLTKVLALDQGSFRSQIFFFLFCPFPAVFFPFRSPEPGSTLPKFKGEQRLLFFSQLRRMLRRLRLLQLLSLIHVSLMAWGRISSTAKKGNELLSNWILLISILAIFIGPYCCFCGIPVLKAAGKVKSYYVGIKVQRKKFPSSSAYRLFPLGMDW